MHAEMRADKINQKIFGTTQLGRKLSTYIKGFQAFRDSFSWITRFFLKLLNTHLDKQLVDIYAYMEKQ